MPSNASFLSFNLMKCRLQKIIATNFFYLKFCDGTKGENIILISYHRLQAKMCYRIATWQDKALFLLYKWMCVVVFRRGDLIFCKCWKIREVFRNRGSIVYKPRSSYGLFECRIIAYKDISPFVAYWHHLGTSNIIQYFINVTVGVLVTMPTILPLENFAKGEVLKIQLYFWRLKLLLI